MSQKITRAGAAHDEIDKRQTNSPVKDVKKKTSAAEQEKPADKQTDKPKDDHKGDKTAKRQIDSPAKEKDAKKKSTAATEKDKTIEKAEKQNEKATEKNKDDAKPEKSTKVEQKPTEKRTEKAKENGQPEKQNGVHNGVTDVTLNNGSTDDGLNGTSVSPELDEEDAMIIIENENDELFPELKYDEASDSECFERSTPDNGPSRSFTRRSQAKSTRTPETPRPASDKDKKDLNGDDKANQDSAAKDAKVSRKLRSGDRPTPEPKLDAVIDVDKEPDTQERRRETNYSKCRAKVSPYRRLEPVQHQPTTSGQAHDASTCANYTGNNTTMEMDLTESFASTSEDPSLASESSFINNLRQFPVRGRHSYKQLKPMQIKKVDRSTISMEQLLTRSYESDRPTVKVIGRKRKPAELTGPESGAVEQPKRSRTNILEHVISPFKNTVLRYNARLNRRDAPIVGINSDVPMSTPVAVPETFDPEVISTPVVAVEVDPEVKHATEVNPTPDLAVDSKIGDSKRCIIM